MNECREFQLDLSAHLDGELSAEETERLVEHLAGCEACRQERDRLKKLDGLLNLVEAPAPGADFDEGLRARITSTSTVWTCEKVRPELVAYLDGEVIGRERQGIETHLIDCADCRAELTGFKKSWQLLDAIDVPEPGADFTARVRERVGSGQDEKPSAGTVVAGPWRFRRAMAIAAGILLAVTLFWFGWLFVSPTNPSTVAETPTDEKGETSEETGESSSEEETAEDDGWDVPDFGTKEEEDDESQASEETGEQAPPETDEETEDEESDASEIRIVELPEPDEDEETPDEMEEPIEEGPNETTVAEGSGTSSREGDEELVAVADLEAVERLDVLMNLELLEDLDRMEEELEMEYYEEIFDL